MTDYEKIYNFENLYSLPKGAARQEVERSGGKV